MCVLMPMALTIIKGTQFVLHFNEAEGLSKDTLAKTQNQCSRGISQALKTLDTKLPIMLLNCIISILYDL